MDELSERDRRRRLLSVMFYIVDVGTHHYDYQIWNLVVDGILGRCKYARERVG